MELLQKKQELLEKIQILTATISVHQDELRQIDLLIERKNQILLNPNKPSEPMAEKICNTKGINCEVNTLILFMLHNMLRMRFKSCSIADIVQTLQDRGYECDNMNSIITDTFDVLLEKKLISHQGKEQYAITEKGNSYVVNLVQSNATINEELLLSLMKSSTTIAELTSQLMEHMDVNDPAHILDAVKKLVAQKKVEKILTDDIPQYRTVV